MKKIYSNFTSMSSKLGLVIGISTFLIASILIGYTTFFARKQAIRTAEENAAATARDHAGQLKTEIEKGLTSARVLAQALSGIKSPAYPQLSIDRNGANAMLKEVLMQNESFYGTFSSWEANAFDHQDESFRNFDAGHDSTGRFIPYWFKENGEPLLETTLGYDTDSYYTIPRDTKAEAVMDPVTYTVNGKRVSLITIVAPILNNHQFHGLAGVDIATDWMQAMVQNTPLFEGKAQIDVISHNGTIAATTRTDTLLGHNLKKVFPQFQDQIASLGAGTEGVVFSDSTLKVHTPIFLGNSNTPWQLSISIPSNVILADANAQMWRMILISTALLLITLISIVAIVRKLIKPLEAMVLVTEKVAEGDLTHEEIKAGNDEIGRMNRAFTQLMNGLRKTTEFANQIGKGNLEAEFTALSEKDVLGNALISMRDSLNTIAEEDKKRNWATEGLAKFGDILRRDNEDLTALADNILFNMVKYMGANQGGMFILSEDENEKYLELIATYAWDRKRFKQNRLAMGEGLAGQAVLEEDYIYLTDVPQEYMNITSGLGKANPTAVLIMPLKVNDHVMGIIELASFNTFEPYQIEFLAKVGESIASTLSTAKINLTTRRLLEESRLFSEEKRAADEELLQNQEELMAIQEELERTISELKEENFRLKETSNTPKLMV